MTTFITFLPALTILFVTVDPVGNMPLFMSLTDSPREDYPKQMARRSVFIGGIVLLGFALAGEWFLNLLGITLPALRISGGIMLFFVALQMVFDIETHQKEKEKEADTHFDNDVSVFPLAIPLIAGPGAITSIILLMSERAGNVTDQTMVIAALFIILLATYSLFRLSSYFSRLISPTINQVISKILGIVLAAMASQFVVDGIRTAINA